MKQVARKIRMVEGCRQGLACETEGKASEAGIPEKKSRKRRPSLHTKNAPRLGVKVKAGGAHRDLAGVEAGGKVRRSAAGQRPQPGG